MSEQGGGRGDDPPAPPKPPPNLLMPLDVGHPYRHPEGVEPGVVLRFALQARDAYVEQEQAASKAIAEGRFEDAAAARVESRRHMLEMQALSIRAQLGGAPEPVAMPWIVVL